MIRVFCLCLVVVSSGAIELFNGTNLHGWYSYLRDTKRQDPRSVFAVTNGVIRISGDGLGYLATESTFTNYQLVVEFRWGEKNWHWADRVGKARDSGLFLHATGPDGNSHDGEGAFMAAIECNIFEGAVGDFLLIRGNDENGKLIAPSLTARVVPTDDGWFMWQWAGETKTIERWGRINHFPKDPNWCDVTGFRGENNRENPHGEWNTLECIVRDGAVQIRLNGIKVNEAARVWPDHGKILLQCEGSEIFFRRVTLFPLERATVTIPKRPLDAVAGSDFIKRIERLDLPEREAETKKEALSGNVPDFYRGFVPIRAKADIDGRERWAEYYVAPDYFCIGSGDDYFLTPMRPETAQAIADAFGCVLPTARMVDQIHEWSAVKLASSPIPPSTNMTKVPVFAEHNATIRKQRVDERGVLIAGHKKDVVITARLTNSPGKVAIYGWHKLDGKPIQPLYLGHTSNWVDYSHGARLVLNKMTIDGEPTTVESVLADPKLSTLLSDEGPVQAGYAVNAFREKNVEIHFEAGVRVVINSPGNLSANQQTRLVLYALPNGNSIEQTMGRELRPGDDWRFNIQHIGAQTRWLRNRFTNESIVVAYLECAEKAWPVWRRKHDPENVRIPKIVGEFRRRFSTNNTRVTLTGHSGGGSFTFGFIDGVEEIPNWVERIAFLDSNYAYDAAKGHAEKLVNWLKASDQHFLCVLAYHDSVALLNGKTFVSEAGGTWGRSHAMIADLERLQWLSQTDDEWERHRALGGRVQFFLKKNPTKSVLHTVQVERNGFIHGMVAGTQAQDAEYRYFGERVYVKWIDP